MSVYYNEIDPYCVAWLRNLIAAGHLPAGDVDERDIRDVQADEVAGYAQCHFFAGVGGWPLALQFAGYPDVPCWTGSCPCQPFSAAGKRAGFADDRHLWPDWFRLIAKRRPPIVFGEQVARAHAWLALVRRDLEALAYAVGAMPVEAASVGANHFRDRYWFVADTNRVFRNEWWTCDTPQRQGGRDPNRSGLRSDVSHAGESRLSLSEQEAIRRARRRDEGRATAECGWWTAEPAVGRVAHGLPGRVAKLCALGNAIVPQCAAVFIESYFAARGVGNVG